MKLYFAEAYTLKENNWAAEIIGYSAEQLLNNEPPRSCPKNRQNRLKKRAPQRKDHQPVPSQLRPKPERIPRPPAAQATDKRRNTANCCRPCSGLRILSPKDSSGTVPFAKEHSPISRRRDIRILRGTKKGQTLRSDLEEAATYSPTGKPQYHRRE